MAETSKTKKGRSARELAGGWAILLVTSPFIAFAIGMSVVALTAAFFVTISGTFDRTGGLLMLLVYGVCVAIMLTMLFRILKRSSFLARRIYRIRQEQQRTADLPERTVQRLSLNENSTSDTAENMPEEQLQKRHF